MKTTLTKLAFTSLIGIATVCTSVSKAGSSYASQQTGNWSTASTWNLTGTGGTPVNYTITAGHTVTLDVNVSGIDTLYIYGTLNFGNNKVLTMNQTGTIILGSTGVITGGSNNTKIKFGTTSSTFITGPFTTANGNQIENGPRYANYATMIAAAGDPQGSFPITLPVDIKSFVVTQTGNQFEANWVALGESNTHDFNVEISTNGVDFSSAGIVEGNNEISEGQYRFKLGNRNGNFYVRLSEIQNNSSQKLAVKFVKNSAAVATNFNFFPTVINNNTESANIMLPVAGNYQVMIFNTSMQNVSTEMINTQTDNELKSVSVNHTNMNTGIYFVVVNGDNGLVYKTKIVVQ